MAAGRRAGRRPDLADDGPRSTVALWRACERVGRRPATADRPSLRRVPRRERGPGHARSGAGRYTIDLAAALLAPTTRPRAGARRPARRRPALASPAGRTRPTGRPGRCGPGPRRPGRPGWCWEQLGLPSPARRGRADVHHGPHYTMPERARRARSVVTVHDCTFFDHPEWHERSKVLVFRRAIRVAARRAGAIVCVSQATAERLAAVCRRAGAGRSWPPTGSTTAGSARPSRRRGATRRRSAPPRASSPARPYVMFIGTIEPRKGVADLVTAFDRVAGTTPRPAWCWPASRGGGPTSRAGAALATARHRDRVVRTGYVPDEAVPGPAAAGGRGRLPVARGGLRPAGPRGPGLRGAPGHHRGHGHGRGGGRRRRPGAAGRQRPIWPTRSTRCSRAEEPVGGGRAPAPRGLRSPPARTWAASAAAHLDAYRPGRRRSDRRPVDARTGGRPAADRRQAVR